MTQERPLSHIQDNREKKSGRTVPESIYTPFVL